MPNVHSGQLARYLGEADVARLSAAMRGWYGPPIALGDAPGAVWCHGDGDFSGTLRAGYEASVRDRAADLLALAKRRVRSVVRRRATLPAGFASLAEVMTADRQTLPFYKSQTTTTAAALIGCAYIANDPITVAATPPGGTTYTNDSAGAMRFRNPPAGDTAFVLGAEVKSSVVTSLLLYDQLFGVKKTINSTTAESVTGVPTRYQSTTPGAEDYAGGNFCGIATLNQSGTGAHNWTVCQYTNQAGTTGQSFPSMGGHASPTTGLLDHQNMWWFLPLSAGDTGVKAISQMQCSAATATGYDFFIGHPLAWFSSRVSALVSRAERTASAFGMTRVFNDACLQFIVVCPGSGTTTMHGAVQLASS